ncbi:formate--tetrahydrofolate ligase, partial [Ruthenibacterium lactatiformans]|uniref:formate--tetrahydrofolate ligase n=1 Tax=Ruthenibacterium lactatiformans TaxID=1550024 RepID=UPI00210DEB12
SEEFAKGGAGGLELAEDVLGILVKRPVRFTYPDGAPVADKVRAVCKNIYGAADVAFSAAAKKQLAESVRMYLGLKRYLEENGYAGYTVHFEEFGADGRF